MRPGKAQPRAGFYSRILLASRHRALLDDVAILVQAHDVHGILEGNVLTCLAIVDDGLLHIREHLLDARHVLDQHTLDALGQSERRQRAVDASATQGNVDDAILVINLRDVQIAAIGLNLRTNAANHIVEHASVYHCGVPSYATRYYPHCRLPLDELLDDNSTFTVVVLSGQHEAERMPPFRRGRLSDVPRAA